MLSIKSVRAIIISCKFLATRHSSPFITSRYKSLPSWISITLVNLVKKCTWGLEKGYCISKKISAWKWSSNSSSSLTSLLFYARSTHPFSSALVLSTVILDPCFLSPPNFCSSASSLSLSSDWKQSKLTSVWDTADRGTWTCGNINVRQMKNTYSDGQPQLCVDLVYLVLLEVFALLDQSKFFLDSVFTDRLKVLAW